MSALPILSSKLSQQQDVPLARQRARQISAGFGLEALAQTRLATAVSEIARNALTFGQQGLIEFLFDLRQDTPMLLVRISDKGPGIAATRAEAALDPRAMPRPPGTGIEGSRRLVDWFDMQSDARGTRVELGLAVLALPPGGRRQQIERIVGEIARGRRGDPLAELEQQNRELLRALDALSAHREQLRQADQRKDEFLAMLAHELRNPLAAIVNGVEFLRARRSAEPAWRNVEDMMSRQTQHLSRLIDDLLDVSRITQGTVQLHCTPVEAASLIAMATETSEALVGARAHQLTVELPSTPLWVHGDVTRLTQVLGNLLNNAAKYTPQGGHIWLRLSEEDGQAVFSVADNGHGIDAPMLPAVFDLFTRAPSARHGAESGLGIGLTIVKRMAELHGGSVTARSAGLGQGSEFVVRLPTVAPPQSAENAAPTDRASAAQRWQGDVLVVDDNVDSAESLALLLDLYGYPTRTAHDGPAALEAVAQRLPRVVILDIGMPDMDGFEVARRLRRLHGPERLLLIGLSGYGDDSVARDAVAAGFDHRLVKPADMSALCTLLAEVR